MIFVSVPYSHKDKSVIEFRVKMLSLYCAKLLRNGIWNLTPVTHGTTIFKYTTLPSDFQFWKDISYQMIKVCTEVHVLMLEGWQESEGVQGEIKFAKKYNIPIIYITVKSEDEYIESYHPN
jgi:hypothetical protein